MRLILVKLIRGLKRGLFAWPNRDNEPFLQLSSLDTAHDEYKTSPKAEISCRLVHWAMLRSGHK